MEYLQGAGVIMQENSKGKGVRNKGFGETEICCGPSWLAAHMFMILLSSKTLFFPKIHMFV